MAKQTFVFLWLVIASLAMPQVLAKEAKQEKPVQTEKKTEENKKDKKAAEEASEPEKVTHRSWHLPQFLEMIEEPPESSPALLGQLRQEKEQLESLIKEDQQIIQAVKQDFENKQSALPRHEWKEALISRNNQERAIQQRIARNLDSLGKIKNELTYLTGTL